MNLSHFCIERPIFATVLSIIVVLIGGISYFSLPVAQYPEVAPPTIQVSASYPGASATTIADTVATPLEQEINGVENMLYMFSQATQDGRLTLTITFALGTDLDEAQVLVQNRVAIAEPRLPEPVRRLGVTTRKNSPDFLMVVHLFSPDSTYDQLYMSNYATLRLRDVLARLDGVGQVQIFGASEYAMRVWLDPDKIGSLDLTGQEVVNALREQNVQVAGGIVNQPPVPQQNAFEFSVQTLGRLVEPEQFENVIVKSGRNERVVRLGDVGRVELGAQDYTTRAYLNESPAVAMLLFQRPGSNALGTAEAIISTMEELSEGFPPGLEFDIVYNPTEFIAESIDEVYVTIYEAVALVVLVIVVFLQSLRATIIPIVAIPISLIGTFAVMAALGFSLNNLSLFGLVLAIGIVVDDAIVVIENVERNISEGLSPKEATHKAMDEVGSALIATSLVLAAVFIPTAFLGGISGQFYRQFALTIAVATLISTLVSLTLSPALSGLLMKPTDPARKPRFWELPARLFFTGFNRVFDALAIGYGRLTARLVRTSLIVVVVYAGLIALTYERFQATPTGFIPAQDQGYVIVVTQLPPGASLERTDAIIRQAIPEVLRVDGVTDIAAFTGFSGATSTNATNAAAMFPVLEPFRERSDRGRTAEVIAADINALMARYDEAFTIVVQPPPVRGIGNAGGFSMMIQDRAGFGLDTLKSVADDFAARANQEPALSGIFTLFETSTPQIYLDIDRTRAEKLGVPVANVFDTLEIFLGSAFVNDFNFLSRTFRVTAQADAPYRLTEDDIMRLEASSSAGEMVPIGSVASLEYQTGSSRVPRYNLYSAARIQGAAAPGFSTGEALDAMERVAAEVLPAQMGYEWTEIAYQQRQTGNTAGIVFLLAVVFVFLILAAQYESWTMPLAVILIVPMVLLCAVIGISFRGIDNNIMVQIGFVVLIGLASKNAILIVEFALALEDQGRNRFEAAIEAAKLRLRPILMTSFAFILGVVPLMIASGAGAEMRQALGTAVFSGMLGVTFFGLLFTPVFYVMTRWGTDRPASGQKPVDDATVERAPMGQRSSI
ncbi:MAG: efflux RND transporter permease subunit [Geminicoccaceae bacterium]